MSGETCRFMDVLPTEEKEVLSDDAIDVSAGEPLANGAAMLMPNLAGGLVENLPAALPGQIAEIGVFEIEGPEEMIESAEFQELAAVKRGGSTTGIEAG